MRALLEEEFPQSGLGIYFCSFNKEEANNDSVKTGATERFRYSTLEQIKVNDQGRIQNWPSGFLDDDVKESQRLMEIMYPPPEDKRGEE